MKKESSIKFGIFFISLVFITWLKPACAITTNINTNSSQAAAGNVAPPATNVLLYYFTLNVTVGNSTFTSIDNFTTSGSYVAADITNLKLWMSNFEFFGGGSLVNIATLTGASIGPGAHTFTFTNPLPTGVVQRYFWITTDVASTAICTHTIRCDLLTNAMYNIPATKNYGTNTAAGIKTILAGTCLPLPIELLSFSGKNNGTENILEWKTASETNNDYFTLERSSDANSFQPIAKIEGAGNSTNILSYYHIDATLTKTDRVLYYRLKQTDFDHQLSYSDIVSIYSASAIDKPPTAFFDPLTGNVSIRYRPQVQGMIVIDIMDLWGRPVFQKQFYRDVENNPDLILPVSSSSSGIYIVKISDEDGRLLGNCKFLK